MIIVPVKAPKLPSGYEMRSVPFLDPHLLFDQLFTTIGLRVSLESVREYWRVHRDELKEDWATQSPASSDHIPVAFYGDAAKIQDDGTKARWCVFAIEEHKFYGHHTMNAVLRRLVYSCNIMFTGVDPDRPHLTLAGGRKFTITELKGDWLWHKQIWRFWSSWARADNVCFRCSAKGRSANPGELFYCMDAETRAWEEYDVLGFLTHQIQQRDPCALL